MDHRHLLPEEIDLLLDGEEGFGVLNQFIMARRYPQGIVIREPDAVRPILPNQRPEGQVDRQARGFLHHA